MSVRTPARAARAVAGARGPQAGPQAPEVASTAVSGGALDLHEGISDAGPRAGHDTACGRWPEDLRLRAGTLLVPGRCKAVNLCGYCARLASVENAEVLALDAVHGVAPSVWLVLTTRATAPEPRAYYESRRQLQRAFRRRFPECEVAWILEFTTGYGTNAGGERRPHWNVLVKGVPDTTEAHAHLLDCVFNVWCAREDAELPAQHVGSIGEMGGLMRYLALHFQKESQAPPAGWRGHRFTKSRGYLWVPTPEAREAARASLRYRREVWKIEQRADAAGLVLEAATIHELATAAVVAAGLLDWELVRLVKLPATWDEDTGRPATWSEEVFAVAPR